ncbi:unnamed protein product [Psylliodes chrysocephalus]|uniref:Double jelly roll-like domain-containing protein n=1 Tax=Psylliodes chrysocephalus TaxID=3402493 RepID=A0A9P0GG62_9CUCU|nr:unnamed protein product [Psylliodes chrysocephala]
MFQMFDTKPQFDESFRKVESRIYTPFIKSFNNNDAVEIIIKQVDSFFLMSDALLCIKGKLDVNGGGDVSLAPNFGAFLFDSCSYSESSKEIEVVRDTGIVSTIRSLLCYKPEDSKHMSIGGWNYPNNPHLNKQNKFSLVMRMDHLFNVLNDYTLVTCGNQTFRLIRARNDNDSIIITEKPIAGGGITDTTAKIIIESLELRVKHIFPNDEIKIELMESIKKDRSILIPFRKWELNELPAITAGAKREIWSVKTSASVERPRFVIVCFQTDKRSNVKANAICFDDANVSSIRLSLNGEYWPNERIQHDFKNDDYMMAFHDYTEFYASYSNSKIKHPLLDYTEFKKHALFVIDCSKQEEKMKSSTVDVRLEIESDTGFPANTKNIKRHIIHIQECPHIPESLTPEFVFSMAPIVASHENSDAVPY